MTWRRPASRVLLGLGLLLAAGALQLLGAGYLLPADGFRDLGRFVGATLLLGMAGAPFALLLLLARGTGMPRWMVALAATGAPPRSCRRWPSSQPAPGAARSSGSSSSSRPSRAWSRPCGCGARPCGTLKGEGG